MIVSPQAKEPHDIQKSVNETSAVSQQKQQQQNYELPDDDEDENSQGGDQTSPPFTVRDDPLIQNNQILSATVEEAQKQ